MNRVDSTDSPLGEALVETLAQALIAYPHYRTLDVQRHNTVIRSQNEEPQELRANQFGIVIQKTQNVIS